MGLILRYGSYQHAEGECEVFINRQMMETAAGFQYGVKETWTIHGFLATTTQALLTTAIINLKAAYSLHGQNLGLYLSDGTTLTDHYVTGNTPIGGVRVVSGPSFPKGHGGEYSTFRSYEITLEAEFSVVNQATIHFNEVLTFTGGGPRFVYLQPLQGLPQKQQVAQSTPYRAVQSGSVIGLLDYVAPPTSLWPADEDIEQRKIDYLSPKREERGNHFVYRNFEVRWSYVFTAVAPLVARPTYWV